MNENNYTTLSIYVGPMYAGKSTRLIKLYNELNEKKQNVCVITHSDENRYSYDKLSSHNNEQISCKKYKTLELFKSSEVDILKTIDHILIDEAQFFVDLNICLDFVEKMKIHVSIFGLDCDFQRNKFGKILDLVPYCDYFEKLKGKCSLCDSNSLFSHRKNDFKQQVLIGKNDLYEPLCRFCFLKKNP
tara:strand:- start:987 stop:1550 length:564 start_codon:yes stop_codon:yes gene_type:complete